jgi:hypothetical protein
MSSCSQKCAVFKKLRSICTESTCANVGHFCWNFGAPNTTSDCAEWCCVEDTSTIAIFAVVFVIVGICCCICCGLALYRIHLRRQKEQQMDENAMYEDDVTFQYPAAEGGRPYTDSNDSSGGMQHYAGGGYGAKRSKGAKNKSTTSQHSSYGKTVSGEQYGDEGTYNEDMDYGDDNYYTTGQNEKDAVWEGEFDDTRAYEEEDDYGRGGHQQQSRQAPSHVKYLPPQDDFGSSAPSSQRSTGRNHAAVGRRGGAGGRSAGRGAGRGSQWMEQGHPFAEEDDF